jgi:hypothetical protein
MASAAQITANKINSLSSSGPTSPEGKKRASLNSFRHGFTGQTVIVLESEGPIYKSHCADYHAEFRPRGKFETDLVQEMADLRWSINRIRAQETNMMAIAAVSETCMLDSGDPEINSVLAIAAALSENAKTLATLSLYEQRKLRAFEKAEKRLREVQKERKAAERADLVHAADYHRNVARNEENWNPAANGFVCSSAELDAFMQQEHRKKQAYGR